MRAWTEYVGSRWYRAPEMLAGSVDYGLGVDVWASACLAAEMRSGRPLFPGEDEGELVSEVILLSAGPRSPDDYPALLSSPGIAADRLGPLVGPASS